MRIAQVAPLYFRIPPDGYGGTERVVHALTEGLVADGQRVTLFAAKGTKTSAELHTTTGPLWEETCRDPFAYRILQIEELVHRSDEFDVIHSHVEYLPWLAGERIQAPVVTTFHGGLDSPETRRILRAYRGQPLVSISDGQRVPVADLGLNWVATIHHGMPLDATYHLGDGGGGYLLFLGRISAEKDPVTAIRVAIRAGLPLKIAARIAPQDQEYFESEVRPLLDHPLVEWLGEQGDASKDALLGGALALLIPIEWDEPFGLVFIEALAAGTPVISRPRGSLPSLMRHGEHGFLVWTEDEMVEACKAVGSMDRAVCRQWALTRFSVSRMVDEYQAAYRKVLRGARPEPWRPPQPATEEAAVTVPSLRFEAGEGRPLPALKPVNPPKTVTPTNFVPSERSLAAPSSRSAVNWGRYKD